MCSSTAGTLRPCNTDAMKAKIVGCWADGGAAECIKGPSGWNFDLQGRKEKNPEKNPVGTLYCKPKPDGMTGGTGGTTKPGGNSELTCPHKQGSLGEKDVCYKFEEAAEQGNFDCKKHCE